jgi:hypothetical protein
MPDGDVNTLFCGKGSKYALLEKWIRSAGDVNTLFCGKGSKYALLEKWYIQIRKKRSFINSKRTVFYISEWTKKCKKKRFIKYCDLYQIIFVWYWNVDIINAIVGTVITLEV